MDTQGIHNRYVVIVGMIGNGKSSTGNTLLGEHVFESRRSLNSVTHVPETHSKERNGKTYTFVDTPGFFDPNGQPTDVLKAVQQSVRLCPHVNAFLLVFNGAARLGKDEVWLPLMLSMMIGPSCLKRIIVLFTHGNEFTSDKEFKEFITESELLANIINDCSGIVCKVENRKCPGGYSEDVEGIFNAIEHVSSTPKGPYEWTHDDLLTYEEVFMKAFENRDEELEDQLRKAIKELKSSRLGMSWKNVALFSTSLLVATLTMGLAAMLVAAGESSVVASAVSAVAGYILRRPRFF